MHTTQQRSQHLQGVIDLKKLLGAILEAAHPSSHSNRRRMLATNRSFKVSSIKTLNPSQPTPKVNSLTRRFNSTPRKTDIYYKRALGRASMFAPKTIRSSTRSFSVVQILTFHMTPFKANSTRSILERGSTAASSPNQLIRETRCLSKDPLSSL